MKVLFKEQKCRTREDSWCVVSHDIDNVGGLSYEVLGFVRAKLDLVIIIIIILGSQPRPLSTYDGDIISQ